MSATARATARALFVTAMICGVATSARSHHAAAPVFDLNTEKTITGVVKQVDWTNPHIWVWVDVQKRIGSGGDVGIRRDESKLSVAPRMDAHVTAARDADHCDVPAAAGRESRRHVHDREARGRHGPDERQLNSVTYQLRQICRGANSSRT
jgi:hypothetical protein